MTEKEIYDAEEELITKINDKLSKMKLAKVIYDEMERIANYYRISQQFVFTPEFVDLWSWHHEIEILGNNFARSLNQGLE